VLTKAIRHTITDLIHDTSYSAMHTSHSMYQRRWGEYNRSCANLSCVDSCIGIIVNVTCNVYPIYCPEYPKLISRCKKVFCMLCELWMHLVQDTRHATLCSFIIHHILFYSLDAYSFFKVRDDEISRVNGQGSFLETGRTIMKRFSRTYKAYVPCCSIYKRIYMCHFL